MIVIDLMGRIRWTLELPFITAHIFFFFFSFLLNTYFMYVTQLKFSGIIVETTVLYWFSHWFRMNLVKDMAFWASLQVVTFHSNFEYIWFIVHKSSTSGNNKLWRMMIQSSSKCIVLYFSLILHFCIHRLTDTLNWYIYNTNPYLISYHSASKSIFCSVLVSALILRALCRAKNRVTYIFAIPVWWRVARSENTSPIFSMN